MWPWVALLVVGVAGAGVWMRFPRGPGAQAAGEAPSATVAAVIRPPAVASPSASTPAAAAAGSPSAAAVGVAASSASGALVENAPPTSPAGPPRRVWWHPGPPGPRAGAGDASGGSAHRGSGRCARADGRAGARRHLPQPVSVDAARRPLVPRGARPRRAACTGTRAPASATLEPRYVAVHNALAAMGLAQIGPLHEGALAQGQETRVSLELPAGCSTVVAVGGGGIRDVDVSVQDAPRKTRRPRHDERAAGRRPRVRGGRGDVHARREGRVGGGAVGRGDVGGRCGGGGARAGGFGGHGVAADGDVRVTHPARSRYGVRHHASRREQQHGLLRPQRREGGRLRASTCRSASG